LLRAGALHPAPLRGNATPWIVLTGPSFRLLAGTPKVYVKTAESGTRRRQSFCEHCGTPIASSADSDTPPAYSLRIGPLAQRALLPPRRRQWCRSALDWSQDLSALPAVEGQAS